MAEDPCAFSPNATSVAASGVRAPLMPAGFPSATTAADFDCFYVYPTVSKQDTANANLQVQKTEIDSAAVQASQFSQLCSVWAPMYRQATAVSIATAFSGAPGATGTLQSTFSVAYDSLLSAWDDFVAHDAGNRPIILIGDSQGSAILIHLIATQFDNDAALRRRLVVAILAGGNLQVPTGEDVGATFSDVPLCTAPSQSGCAIAYSAFPSEPPSSAVVGRPGQGVSLQSGQATSDGEQVACVNPTALGGGTGQLTPLFVSTTQTGLTPAVATPWVTYPGLYSATCTSQGGATWLQVTDIASPGDTRPVVTEALGPDWGYHADDINLALGNLLLDVVGEETAWQASH
jgi:Protein of unknown function (DUF3089)